MHSSSCSTAAALHLSPPLLYALFYSSHYLLSQICGERYLSPPSMPTPQFSSPRRLQPPSHPAARESQVGLATLPRHSVFSGGKLAVPRSGTTDGVFERSSAHFSSIFGAISVLTGRMPWSAGASSVLREYLCTGSHPLYCASVCRRSTASQFKNTSSRTRP
ncbi:hypothetical protein L226DRAFT_341810 [Lentinus tigrinus ALCF2SS1-7]|uniref:uncharacterized protein n=1 Tax=Lentinus tigrinus ALCF2SS1-7 TaxID=1328758 RepID=UPI001165F6BB|nr:hypothetical protein L226DRAFT_341810 [Lentinus tigrinus ALCF2SS1-7]